MVAAKLGYIPNITAKILKGGSSGSVGVFAPSGRFGIHSVLLSEVVSQLHHRGFDPQVKVAEHGDSDRMARMTRDFEMRGVDGIIFCRTDELPSHANVPHVTISNARDQDSTIGTDLYLGGFMATEHLIRHGRKRIAVLAEREYFCDSSIRFSGWRDALLRHGLPYDPRLMIHGRQFDFDFDRLGKLLTELRIDAIFCKNDYIGGKIVYELPRRGIRIPDDIAVIGFDGMSFCDFCAVPLATIAQPVCLLAQNAVSMLLDLMKAKQIQCSGPKISMPPLLIPNVSCGCHPDHDTRFFHLNTYQTLELDRMENFGEDIFRGRCAGMPGEQSPRRQSPATAETESGCAVEKSGDVSHRTTGF